jgi:hypothetical protein
MAQRAVVAAKEVFASSQLGLLFEDGLYCYKLNSCMCFILLGCRVIL